MSNQDDNTATPAQWITVVGVETAKNTRTRGKREIVERTLDVEAVRNNFTRFLDGLWGLVGDEEPSVGSFELDEIQFSAEISANGEFKLLGTGVGIEASTGVVFTLKRSRPNGAG
jgi:hypothetical protein